MILRGIAASDGIGIGKAVCVREQSLDYSAVKYGGKEVEKDRLQAAITQFNEKTTAMAEHIRAQVGEKESEILTGQIMMLSDPFMQSQMEEVIDAGQCAEAAVDQVCTMYAEMFAGVDDELMRQRATDVRDIRSRMLAILLGVTGVDVSHLPAGSVLVAHDLTPSMTVGLDKEHVAAILTEVGGRTSHSAILARALELKCDGAVLKHAGAQAALDYQEVLVKTLVSSHKQKNKGFSSYRVTELVSSQKEDILQRVELILQARQRHRKVAPLALAGIMALLPVCSYSVVVQPAYYPSMEEITEGQYTPVTTWNSWLAQESDGDYILYCKGEEPIPVSDKTAGIMLDQGFPLRQ